MGTAQSRRVQKTVGEGVAETGSVRRTEVSDSCGGLPHTRTFGILVRFFQGEKRGDVEAAKRRAIQLFLNREPLPYGLLL
jgi:hypothetical protein